MKAIEQLNTMTGSNFGHLTKRGNDAILKALKICKKLGYKDVYIADQGGWITYRHFSIRLKLNLHDIESDYGVIDVKHVKKIKKSILLLNSFPGYIAKQPMEEIKKVCEENKNILIEDITATIGGDCFGDILVASFSDTKIIEYGKLGYIAYDNPEYEDLITYTPPEVSSQRLLKKIDEMEKRREYLITKSSQVKVDLAGFDIIYPIQKSINVIVKYKSDIEKDQIIKYCDKNDIPYVECPKYHKVITDAISIEIKKIVKNTKEL